MCLVTIVVDSGVNVSSLIWLFCNLSALIARSLRISKPQLSVSPSIEVSLSTKLLLAVKGPNMWALLGYKIYHM